MTPKQKPIQGNFFKNNESLARIFKVSQKQINTLLQRLASENENWISIRNTQSPHRRIKLTNKTKELIYLETESILENPDILLGTIGNSNLNQNFPPLGTIGNSHSNQNFTQKRTRKETIKELSKSDKERIQKNFGKWRPGIYPSDPRNRTDGKSQRNNFKGRNR